MSEKEAIERFERKRRLNESVERFNETLMESLSIFDKTLAEFKTDIIKWMFILFVGQIIVLVTILELFFKH